MRFASTWLLICALPALAGWGQSSWQSAADAAITAAGRDANNTALVLDVRSNHLLAAVHPHIAATMRTTPGSTIKPFVLYALLTSGRWSADRVIACRRSLTIDGRRMDCVHPQVTASFDARTALAYSCNTYFSQAALALSGDDLAASLRQSGLASATGLLPSEATGTLLVPHSDAAEQLLALGVDGAAVTPVGLAESYRWLLLQIEANPRSSAAEALQAGLADSVNFGMASASAVNGISISGKTGTAGTFNGSQTHGWFVGYAPADHPQVVVLVYLAHGRGADAALRAHALLAASPLADHR